MDEDKPSQQQPGDIDEQLAKQLQAEEENGEGSSADEEGEEEQDLGVSQLTPEELKIYEAVTKDNMRSYLAEAVANKKTGNYDRALEILKIVLMKGEDLYGDAMHSELAVYYYSMGDFLLEELENNGENPNAEKNNNEMGDKKPTDILGDVANPDIIQSAWENLETARHILQKRVDEGKYGDEEKSSLLNRLATVYVRIGECETWQDKFPEACEMYERALAIRKDLEDCNRSRTVAEIYFVLANATVYMDEEDSMLKAVEFYKKAATIFENIIVDLYEKAGVETVLDMNQQFKRSLLKERVGDDEALKEAKGILKELYTKIEETLTEEESKKLYKDIKKREAEENKQALDAFGKPIAEEAKVNKLGCFGKKAAAAKESEKVKGTEEEDMEGELQKPDVVRTKPN